MADVAVISNMGKSPAPVPEAETVATEKPTAEAEPVVEAEKVVSEDKKVPEVVNEEDLQKKALDEFKALVQEALNKHEFYPPPPQDKSEAEEKATEAVSAEVAGTEEKTVTETTGTKVVVSGVGADVAKDNEVPPPIAATTETTEVEVAFVVSDDDGAKTVEAIAETVVAVSSTPMEQTEQTLSAPPVEAEEEKSPEEVSIWGIPLLADERSDAVLLKFLQARDFKPKEALAMLKKTVLWRKEFDIETLIEQNLENPSLEKFAFLEGFGKFGNPVCYNKFGVFQDKELYRDTFGDDEKRKEFSRWRVQLQEKSIRKMLDFGPGGICNFVQVNDFKNTPFLLKKELRIATDDALQVLQDNYPEFVAKQVFINVPWWYVAFQTMINPFLTQRTKSKFVFVGPSKTTDTLFKYIAPEQVPVEYGGFRKAGEQEFTTADPVTENVIKPSSPYTIELPISEACNSLWEVRVSSWDVSYGAEFVPSAEDGFTVIVQKMRKINQSEETVISGSFNVTGPGKIVLTFNNQTTKKKKLLYRSKTKASDC